MIFGTVPVRRELIERNVLILDLQKQGKILYKCIQPQVFLSIWANGMERWSYGALLPSDTKGSRPNLQK